MLNPGNVLDGKYEVIRILGKGGMSIVYLCKNNRLGNLWAVKEVPKNLNIKIDLLAEPNILKQLNNSGIPRIIDIFHENNSLYIVEDYIEGETLKEYVSSRGSLSNEAIINITSQLCSILQYLHNFNPPIIYRDLKPTNIMVKRDNTVILIDFGIARSFKENQEGDTVILGSQGYIAPEQLIKVQSNIQTDIYSLGAVMYYMASGKTVSSMSDLLSHQNYPPILDSNIIAIIQKAADVNPNNRFISMSELSNSLKDKQPYEKTTILKEENFTREFKDSPTIQNKKKHKKPIALILLGLIALLVSIYFISKFAVNSKKDKMVVPEPASTAAEKQEVKKEPTVQKKVEEKSISIRGSLYKNNPIIINSNLTKPKGKGKDKDKNEGNNYHLLYNLNPSASSMNSTFMVSLYNIEVIDNNMVAYLSVENKSSAEIKLDLTKTYLITSENNSEKCYSPVPVLAIPAHTTYNEIKVYFKNVELKSGSFTLNTYVNKAISLNIDVR